MCDRLPSDYNLAPLVSLHEVERRRLKNDSFAREIQYYIKVLRAKVHVCESLLALPLTARQLLLDLMAARFSCNISILRVGRGEALKVGLVE
jgi:hypothetical protein